MTTSQLAALIVAVFIFGLGLFARVFWRGAFAGLDLVVADETQDPDPIAATYELLAELRGNGAPIEQLDEALDVVVALTKAGAK